MNNYKKFTNNDFDRSITLDGRTYKNLREFCKERGMTKEALFKEYGITDTPTDVGVSLSALLGQIFDIRIPHRCGGEPHP